MGLNELKKRSVSVAVTYGDPSFYSKVGFQALSENVIQAPPKGLDAVWMAWPIVNWRANSQLSMNDPYALRNSMIPFIGNTKEHNKANPTDAPKVRG